MTDKFEAHAIVELFGHNVIAGLVTDQTIGGETFVRVDVPEVEGRPAYTKLFGKGAIYAITPTTEELVERFLRRNHDAPIQPYMLAEPKPVVISEADATHLLQITSGDCIHFDYPDQCRYHGGKCRGADSCHEYERPFSYRDQEATEEECFEEVSE